MSTLLRFKTLAAIAAFCIVFPTFLLSQVIIRERMEIKPKSPDKQTTAVQHPARAVDGSELFYNPPLFIDEPLFHRTGLTLPSTITISGTVDIAGSIGTNQHALVVYVDPSGAEHEIAAKGRDAIGFGGNMYERQSPYTGPLNKGQFPSITLYLFDSQWATRMGQVTMDGNTLTFSFSGLLDQHTLPAAQVTATATVTGSFLPDVQFDHWEILADDMTVTGHDSTWVRFAPMDGTANPGEFSMLSLYRPWGISPSEAGITARVDAQGEYAFLAYNEFVEGGNSPYHSGQELTMSMKYTPFLVYADSLGTFNGSTETVSITVTGGGKSATVPVVLTKNEILLGETKYYYVADVDGWPKIKETSSTSVPEDAMPDSEWGEEPVEVVESGLNSGKRLGVYWERGKPIPNASGTLPDALIRLIGRYWSADSVYKVRLSATDSYGETVSTVIEVEKPARLLTPGQSPTYRLSRDVFDNEINIDDTCIVYGGQYGIPPQFIKAQMDQEAAKKNFGGEIGWGFAPSYRYEPYTAQFWSAVRNRTGSPFFVKESPVNDPPIPSHQYVQSIDYPYPNKSVWDMIYDHSQLVSDIDDGPHRLYGTRRSDGTIDFSPYDTVQARYDEMLQFFKDQGVSVEVAADSANVNMIVYLRDRWNGGTRNIKAQTRIAASYGLLQMMYTKGLERGYKEDREHLPEYLNITDTIMVLSMEYQKYLLKKGLSSGQESGNNWSTGYDEAFWTHVYGIWNKKIWYRYGVEAKSHLYSPQ
jgi:hypothetical protein